MTVKQQNLLLDVIEQQLDKGDMEVVIRYAASYLEDRKAFFERGGSTAGRPSSKVLAAIQRVIQRMAQDPLFAPPCSFNRIAILHDEVVALVEKAPPPVRKDREPRVQWTRASAAAFLGDLIPALNAKGWGVGLTGSVLRDGISVNDLDIILFPHTTELADVEEAKRTMVAVNMRMLLPVETVHEKWRRFGSQDTKQVEVWVADRKKVDVFWLR